MDQETRGAVGKAATLCVAVLIPTLAFGHAEPPKHGCVQPVRPPDKTDVDVWNRFMDQVDAYRSCMSGFIAANHEAAERHRAAANAATAEWNAFVHGSLNVPEDFPWPPQQTREARDPTISKP